MVSGLHTVLMAWLPGGTEALHRSESKTNLIQETHSTALPSQLWNADSPPSS